MKTDVPSLAPPPPPPPSAKTGTVAGGALAVVALRSVSELERDLTQVLQAARLNRALSERASDGTAKIPSLVAVYLLNQVAVALGRPKLVSLSKLKVRREELRSIGGVARLVHRTLHPAPAETVAS
jgi:hypothetical protein